MLPAEARLFPINGGLPPSNGDACFEALFPGSASLTRHIEHVVERGAHPFQAVYESDVDVVAKTRADNLRTGVAQHEGSKK